MRDSRKAKAKRQVLARLADMRENPDDERHGTTTGYIYGCRCHRCRHAWANDITSEHAELLRKRRRRAEKVAQQERLKSLLASAQPDVLDIHGGKGGNMRSPQERDVTKDLCDVNGCEERRRCIDKDRPSRCPLWRMMHNSSLEVARTRGKQQPVVVDGKEWYPSIRAAAAAYGEKITDVSDRVYGHVKTKLHRRTFEAACIDDWKLYDKTRSEDES